MKHTFRPLHYALIQPAHWHAAAARQSELAKICARRAESDNEDDDGGPWWKSEDIWGEALPAPQLVGSTALIPVKGVITSGMPAIYRAIGYADTDEIGAWISHAADDPGVAQIVLSIDSPGGMVTGTPELASIVAAAELAKPVVAHSKGMMDSAAYWIASQARAIYCTPSADVGCIGVYQVHYDWTQFMKDFGVSAEIFKSGDLKAAGHPDIPLSDAQRVHIQAEIDAIGVQFRAAVKTKRTLVEDDSMRGQSFIGTAAAARNLVAGLCTLDALL